MPFRAPRILLLTRRNFARPLLSAPRAKTSLSRKDSRKIKNRKKKKIREARRARNVSTGARIQYVCIARVPEYTRIERKKECEVRSENINVRARRESLSFLVNETSQHLRLCRTILLQRFSLFLFLSLPRQWRLYSLLTSEEPRLASRVVRTADVGSSPSEPRANVSRGLRPSLRFHLAILPHSTRWYCISACVNLSYTRRGICGL